jgi:hypothetical protein
MRTFHIYHPVTNKRIIISDAKLAQRHVQTGAVVIEKITLKTGRIVYPLLYETPDYRLTPIVNDLIELEERIHNNGFAISNTGSYIDLTKLRQLLAIQEGEVTTGNYLTYHLFHRFSEQLRDDPELTQFHQTENTNQQQKF